MTQHILRYPNIKTQHATNGWVKITKSWEGPIPPHSWVIFNPTKMLGCFNPSLGQIWTNSAIGLNV